MAISIVAEKIDISPKKNRTRTEHKKVKGEYQNAEYQI